MAIVVVGGNSRNIGKTSVVAGLIAGLQDFHWTAVKITQYGHGVCSANGEPCDCATADHTIAVSEERNRSSGTDSSRYLAAGAEHSFWVRTQQGELHEAMPRVRRIAAEAPMTLIESNSVLRFLRPDLAISVLDPNVSDFKASALRFLDRINVLVMPLGSDAEGWEGVSPQLLRGKPRFFFKAPEYCPAELVTYVRRHLAGLPEAVTR